MDTNNVKLQELSDSALLQMYQDKVKYQNIDMPPVIRGVYKAVLNSVLLVDIESELLNRHYELPMSN